MNYDELGKSIVRNLAFEIVSIQSVSKSAGLFFCPYNPFMYGPIDQRVFTIRPPTPLQQRIWKAVAHGSNRHLTW